MAGYFHYPTACRSVKLSRILISDKGPFDVVTPRATISPLDHTESPAPTATTDVLPLRVCCGQAKLQRPCLERSGVAQYNNVGETL